MTSLVLLFPGQGSQYVGMGQSFFASSQGALMLEEAESALTLPLRSLMLKGPQAELTSTAVAQPAILLHSIAAYSAFIERHNVNFECAVGHSLGEYSALVAAGVMKYPDALRAVRIRGQLMQEAVPLGQGAMAAVLGLSADKIIQVLESFSDSANYAAVANFNGPWQTVIAGTKAGVAAAGAELKLAGAKRVIELDVSAPFHCALMAPVKQRMKAVLDSISFTDAKFPVISNVSAQPETSGSRIKQLLIDQIDSPVRFTECIENLWSKNLMGDGFIEIGPKNILSGMVKKIIENVEIANIDSLEDLDKFGIKV